MGSVANIGGRGRRQSKFTERTQLIEDFLSINTLPIYRGAPMSRSIRTDSGRKRSTTTTLQGVNTQKTKRSQIPSMDAQVSKKQRVARAIRRVHHRAPRAEHQAHRNDRLKACPTGKCARDPSLRRLRSGRQTCALISSRHRSTSTTWQRVNPKKPNEAKSSRNHQHFLFLDDRNERAGAISDDVSIRLRHRRAASGASASGASE